MYPWISSFLESLLNNAAFQAAIVSLFVKSTVGFQYSVVAFVVDKLLDKVALPVARELVRRGYIVYDKTSGRVKVEKLRNSSGSDFDDAVDSI